MPAPYFISFLLFFSTAVCAADTPADSSELTSAARNLSDWKLTGSGKIVENNILEITGSGKGSGCWISPKIKLQAGGTYRFSVDIQGVDVSGGYLPCGASGYSRVYTAEKGIWKTQSYCFRVPDGYDEIQLQVGQWESSGTFQYRNVKLETVVPVLKLGETPVGNIVLGSGEKIQNGVYHFDAWYGDEGSFIHRPLDTVKCGFNSDRLTFGGGSEISYRFFFPPKVDDGKWLGYFFISGTAGYPSGTVAVNVNYWTAGTGVIEARTGGSNNWTQIGQFGKTGFYTFKLPDIPFFDNYKDDSMRYTFVRIRALENSNFQVVELHFETPIGGYYAPHLQHERHINAHGETLFATSTGNSVSDVLVLADNKIIVKTGSEIKEFPLQKTPLPGKITQKIELPGRSYSLQTETNSFERTDYGYYIDKQIWWAEADWKVPRKRIVPVPETKKEILITAAKNDFEDFQIVVKANDDTVIQGLTGKISNLENGNNIIPAKNVELLYAYYHFVHSKSDGTGMLADYPDALPPLSSEVHTAIDIPAGKNQPLWISVKIPADAAAGTYTGTVELTAKEGMKPAVIPFAVKVWDFALPKENHHETAYGFKPQLACQYHNAKTDTDKRKVIENYWQLFSDHRISIYNPTPFDDYSVKWLPDEKDGGKSRCEIDFTKYDAEMSRVLEKYHFTNFTVNGHGLGGGTYESRAEPFLVKYGADTPQYKAMMTDYYKQLVNHLKEKNWLNKAYVYWFDEPEPKDYDFVADGFSKLKHYAPGLGRMITEEPTAGFISALEKNAIEKSGTFIDIWCPVSCNFDYDSAKQRMALGERFWWYVCCGPRAPYCTLFIDHPATELRVWHWQARQRSIAGSLVWRSNYWTSGQQPPQNPYEDPMVYVADRYPAKWGNGDGRFIYPPLSAAVPDLNDGKVNFEKPVSSIRWEMIREGVEDYEMFYLLDELLKQKGDKLTEAEKTEAEKLLIVPASVSKTMTDFTLDPRPIYEHRNKIGTMIEGILQR
ncbi:MAG: DUF4091 domain-containing protein [Planctomycetaceae bacterium]|jgi:hypothetical protein|nr:DUF4091 domain-containing protein [Planctomycetaceae bacterium]